MLPHASDEVVANLAEHVSSELRADYLADATKLRQLAADVVLPAHVCARNVRHAVVSVHDFTS